MAGRAYGLPDNAREPFNSGIIVSCGAADDVRRPSSDDTDRQTDGGCDTDGGTGIVVRDAGR